MSSSKRFPEKVRKIAEQRNIEVLKEVRIADFGSTYLLDHIQRRIGLGNDLNDGFGTASVSILSIAMTLIQCDGIFDAVEGTMNRTWVRELYSLEGAFNSGILSRFTKKLGTSHEAIIERFFEHRIRRNKGIVAWDTTTIGCNSDMDGLAEYVVNNKDNENLKQVKVGLATDLRGVPLMYRHYAGNVSDMDTVRLLSTDIERFGGSDALFVMDRGFCSGWNLHFMIQNRYRFVVPATTGSKAIKKLLTDFNNTKDAVDLEHEGHMYKVWKTEIGVTKADGRTKANGEQAYTFTLFGDENHSEKEKVTAYVCFDTKKYSDEVQNHKAMISSLKAAAEKIDAKDPVAEFRRKAARPYVISTWNLMEERLRSH